MPIGRRYHRPAEPETIGQRSRGHLRLVEIGRDIDVAHRDVVEQRRSVDEPVEKHHVLGNAESCGAGDKAVAIGLALLAHQGRVSGAEHYIHCVRPRREHGRHGVDHHLDPLVGGEQAKCQDHRPTRKAEPSLGSLRLDEGHIGDAMRNDLDLGLTRAVNADQQFAPLVGHHHNPGRERQDLLKHMTLRGVGLGEDGVERRYHR